MTSVDGRAATSLRSTCGPCGMAGNEDRRQLRPAACLPPARAGISIPPDSLPVFIPEFWSTIPGIAICPSIIYSTFSTSYRDRAMGMMERP